MHSKRTHLISFLHTMQNMIFLMIKADFMIFPSQ